MLALGLIDAVVPEPTGGAHTDPDAATALVDQALSAALAEVSALTVEARLNARYDKFRKMGEEGTSFTDTEKPPTAQLPTPRVSLHMESQAARRLSSR